MFLKCLVTIFILTVINYSNAAVAEQKLDLTKIQKLSHEKYWLRLLHYKVHYPGGFKSVVDGKGFFLAKNGKKNPEAEMLATIAAFSRNIQIGKLKQHPQCAFPERFRYLKQELNLNIPVVPCPLFEEYMQRFNPESVTLVFSSAYANNPASMFGHTFLRINAKANDDPSKQKKMDLLDMGLNYAASVSDDDNGFIFAWKGLTGGYQGQFLMQPYYTKINEYNNSESRDLWEYNLNINEEETRHMLANAWEIETNSYIDYYFLDENCSYQLLALLEVAKPNWNLSSYFLHVVPGETVKQVTKIPGAVKSIKFRPSLYKRTLQHFYALNNSQKNMFFQLLDGVKPVDSVQDIFVLETLNTYLYYKKQKQDGKLSSQDEGLLKNSLFQRSQLRGDIIGGFLPDIPETTRPDLGHGAYRIGTASGFMNISNRRDDIFFQDFHLKFAYHDILNNDLGYSPYSEINFPNFTFRYIPENKKFISENLELASIISLFPINPIAKALSWKVLLNNSTAKDLGCSYCHVFHFELGTGLATNIFSEQDIVYAMFLVNLEEGNEFKNNLRFGPGLESALLWNSVSAYKQQWLVRVISDVFQAQRQKIFYQFGWNHSYSLSQNWEIRGKIFYNQRSQRTAHNYQEALLGLNYYF